MSADPHPENGSSTEVDALLFEYVDRLNAGEILDPVAIEREHPTLAETLIERLEVYRSLGQPGDLALGTLGDYTLRRQIGRGGMGVVYEAWQGSLDRQVALKVLPAGVAADSKAFIRFMREARTAAQLNHPNVVSVYGMGVEQNTPYYSMEYVEGETLAQVFGKIRDADDDPETPFGKKDQVDYFAGLARAFADVADGLQHAHSRGVIHRDIKPSNLIVDRESRLRILDFGLARLEGQESLTLPGDFVGTPLYMSPEQARRRKIPIDHRTDLYSLGATMFEALCGRPPFLGKDHTDTLSQIIERDPVEPRKVHPRVPKDLETVVLKCLRKDPADRYGTAEALAQDLRRFVRGDPIEARPEGVWTRVQGRLRRHRSKLVLAAAFLTLGIAFLWANLERERAERERAVEAYPAAVLDAVTRLTVGQFSLEAGSGRDRFLAQFSSGLLTPVKTEDYDVLLGGEGERAVREAARQLAAQAAVVPEARDAHYHLARAHWLLGDGEGARREIGKTLGIDPGFVPASYLLEEIDGVSSDDGPGSRGRPEREDSWARWWLEARSQEKRRSPPAWSRTVEAYDWLIAAARDGREPYIGCAMEAYLGRGVARLETEDFRGAQEDFLLARHLTGESLEPELLLGKAHYLGDETEYARTIFERLYSNQDPGDRNRAALWISAVYISLRDYEEALRWVRELPPELLRERLRAFLLWSLGRFQNAVAASEEAVRWAPEDLTANALLLSARMSELGASHGGANRELALRLLESSERVVELAPGDPGVRLLQRMAVATARRTIRQLDRRQIMDLKKQGVLGETTWAIVLAMLATAPGGGRAMEVCDDFIADSNPFDCAPVCWRKTPWDEGIWLPTENGGVDVVNTRDTYITGIGTADEIFSGDVKVQLRASLRGTDALLVGSVHWNRETVSGYLAGIRTDERGRGRVLLRRYDHGDRVEEREVPFELLDDLSNPGQVLEIEVVVEGDFLSVRVWPVEQNRPDRPQLAAEDRTYRTGFAGLGYMRRSGPGMGRIYSICISEIESVPHFLRGDCNDDGNVDISDAVCTLSWLFLDGAEPGCVAATNVNGVGEVNLTDPTYLLTYLFLGGPPPVEPFPGCGPGTGADTCETPPRACE